MMIERLLYFSWFCRRSQRLTLIIASTLSVVVLVLITGSTYKTNAPIQSGRRQRAELAALLNEEFLTFTDNIVDNNVTERDTQTLELGRNSTDLRGVQKTFVDGCGKESSLSEVGIFMGHAAIGAQWTVTTVRQCASICMKQGKIYAALERANTCQCLSLPTKNPVCVYHYRQRCHADGLSCGNRHCFSLYYIKSHSVCSLWMSNDDLQLTSCYDRSGVKQGCATRKRLIRKAMHGAHDALLQSKFIGCFAIFSFPEEETQVITPNQTYYQCVKLCEQKQLRYSLISKDSTCTCSDTLGHGEPFTKCPTEYSYTVFSSSSLNESLPLVFSTPKRRKKVLILAYYRGGSTVSSELFDKYPNSVYSFEPDAMVPNLEISSQVEWLLKYIRLFFDCQMVQLPLRFSAVNTFFAPDQATSITRFKRCSLQYGRAMCLPLLISQCLSAPIVAIKTIRLTADPTRLTHLEKFVRENPDIQLLHVTRDPLAIISSRKRIACHHPGYVYRHYCYTDIRNHTVKLCEDMNKVTSLITKLRGAGLSAQHMFYEDLVLHPLEAAETVYRKLFNMELSTRVKQYLNRIMGGNSPGRQGTYMTAKSYPADSLFKWMFAYTGDEYLYIKQRCPEYFHSNDFKVNYYGILSAKDMLSPPMLKTARVRWSIFHKSVRNVTLNVTPNH